MGPQKKYDVIVVGSGIAGLSVALRLADKGHTVGIITKKDSAESNTNYAQGGIAAVTSNSDEIDIHVEDTLKAGDGLCDRLVVEEILRDGPKGINGLIEKGVNFSLLGRWANIIRKRRRAFQKKNSSCERCDRQSY